MTPSAGPRQAGPDGDRARRPADVIIGDLVFIHGFQDTAALWQEVIDRLECPGWTSIPVSLHGTGLSPVAGARPWRAYCDQVGDAIDALDGPSDRPAVDTAWAPRSPSSSPWRARTAWWGLC